MSIVDGVAYENDPANTPRPDDRVLGYVGKEPVINTQAVLNAKGPFGAIDALDRSARLRVLIETAKNFRRNNPDAPVRAAELAVNEVLWLREQSEVHLAAIARLREAANWHQQDNEKLRAYILDLKAELTWEQTPWYEKLINRLSFWIVTGVRS